MNETSREGLSKRGKCRSIAVIAAATLAASAAVSHAQALNGTVSILPVSANDSTIHPYFATDLNSCSVDLNNLITATVGATTYQFMAYYDTGGHIWIGRRTPGDTSASAWTSFNSGITLSTSLLSDDHNIAAIAVDSTGKMNIAWGMHNVTLNYAISNASVMGNSFAAPTFTTQTSANAPTLFPSGGSTTNEATYPDFYNIPGSSNLLFAYRNGGAGGGSGNGNEYFNVYNPTANTWTNSFVINGEQTSVNAYLNNLVYTSTNNLLATWTWRATPNWQSNSNIMFAQSPDNGVSWSQQGGTAYTLPIIQTGSPSTSVAQVIKTLPQNTSFINQTSMAVDVNDNPMVATYWAPGTTGSTNANQSPNGTTNNPNRQYMLVYYDGSAWRTSQISNRTSDTAFDTGGSDVRDLGRPIVVVDKNNRVLVLTRSEDTGLGKFSNPATPNNGLVVYWNTVASLDSATPQAWQKLTLDNVNLGASEPTIDQKAWANGNLLDVMYEPTQLTGESSAAVSELEWDEQSYFASITPLSLTWDANIGTSGAQDGAGAWDTTNLNFFGNSNNFAWNNTVPLSATFGSANAPAGTVTLGANVSAQNLTFNAASSGNYTIAGGGFTLTLISGSTITTNVNATISAPLAGAGFTKAGNSTLTLSGNSSSYTAPVQVSAGTLTVTGSIGSSSIGVSANATLNANGSSNAGLANTALNVSGTANFAAPASFATRTVSSLTINSGGAVNLVNPFSHTNRQLLITSGLTFGGATNTWVGKLDLTGNDMIVKNGSLTNITNQIKIGQGTGTPWNASNGITSTAAIDTMHRFAIGVLQNKDNSGNAIYGATTAFGTFDGQSPGVNDVLVKFTYYGDADLNGKVDAADYSHIDNGANSAGTLSGWVNGDFNYDGSIDGADYTLIDNAANNQTVGVLDNDDAGGLIAGSTAEIFPSTSVPEPTILLWGGILSFGLSARRRRH